MSISQIIEKYHKNRVENIRKMSNGIDRNMAIGSFVADLGKGSIKPIAKAIGSCFRKVKKCYILFTSNSMQMSLKFRVRHSITKKYPNDNTDSFFTIDEYLPIFNREKNKLESLISYQSHLYILISKLGSGLGNQNHIFENLIFDFA